MARFVIKLRDAALDHVLMDKGRIEIRSYTFEHDAQEIAVRLQDSLFHGKFLHMFYARYLFSTLTIESFMTTGYWFAAAAS